jgi:hypothetical protein
MPRTSLQRSARSFPAEFTTECASPPPVSDFDQGIGAAARFLDRERHVVDGRAARRAALVAALVAAVVGVTVNHGAHLESVDRS